MMRVLTFSLATIFVLAIALTGQAATLQDFEGGVGTAVGATSANSPCYGNAWAAISTVAGNGGNVLQHDDGGYGNGVVITFPGAVAADGIYKVTCEIQVNDASNLGMNRSYDILNHEPLCYGFGVSQDGSAVISPNLVSGMYCAWTPNLTAGDDSGLGFQTVELIVPLKAGDLWMWFSTMPNFTTSGTGAWGTDTVHIDNISLTPVADGAIKTVGQGGDYANFDAAEADIDGGTLANQYIALWALDATHIVETAQVEFHAVSATGSLFVCSHPDNTDRAILVGAALNEAYQVDSPGGSVVKLSDLIFIPPYEADGMIGTGANSNYDFIETYRSDLTGTVINEWSNCLFTGSQSDGSPTDPADAWVGGPTQCMYGDDLFFIHSNVATTFDNCILAHVYDDAILTYSDVFMFNNTMCENTGGRAIQNLVDGPGDGAASGNQCMEAIGWSTANPIKIKDCAARATAEQGWTGWGTDGNPEPTLLRFVELTGNGESGYYEGTDRPTVIDYVVSDDNGGEGFSIWFYNTAYAAQRQATITNSSADGNGGRGLKFGRGTTVSVDGFTSTNNGNRGIELDLYAGGVYNMTNMTVTDNGGDSFWHDRGTADTTVEVSFSDFARNAGGFRIRNGLLFDINNSTIRDNTGSGVVVTGTVGANPLSLEKVALQNNTDAGLLLNSAAGVVSVSGCTIIGNATGIASGDGSADSAAAVTVVNTIIAGNSPCYAFANNNSADLGESITVTYSALVWGGANRLEAIEFPGAPNRAADDPFDYSDASVINDDPLFVSTTMGADYLNVDNSAFAGKGLGGKDLAGFGSLVGGSAITEWTSY